VAHSHYASNIVSDVTQIINISCVLFVKLCKYLVINLTIQDYTIWTRCISSCSSCIWV